MSRRGRPPHPDILTPREWEVLALLREGLSDQAIGDRLGISLDGAKYHVREILSKLGVSSRQEAAVWQPDERAPARRWLVLPLAARIGAALVIVAAVAGLGLLAWGVVRTSDEAGGENGLDLPAPGSAPQLDPDEALLRAAGYVHGDVQEVAGGATTWAAAKAAAGDTGTVLGEPRSDAVTWFFRFSGVVWPSQIGPGGPVNPNATPVRPVCMGIAVWFRDMAGERVEGDSVASGLPADCSGSLPATRELAIVLAAEEEYWPKDEPPVASAERITLAEVNSALGDRHAEPYGGKTTFVLSPVDLPVWLVTLRGHFYGFERDVPAGGSTPRPTTTLSCAERFAVVDISSHEILYRAQFQNGTCN